MDTSKNKILLMFAFTFVFIGIIGFSNACVCGDGICEGDETCLTCSNDCGTCEQELPICGNSILEGEEECDKGIFNGFLCWASYGTSCNYCSNSCELKTITNYCGDGIVNSYCEECDDGNRIDDDYCTNKCKINIPEPYCGDGTCNGDETCSTCEEDCGECPEPTCDHEIAIRYSYSNSYGTGIAVGYTNGTWIEGSIVYLQDTENYKIKYFIDNKMEEDDNIHSILKLDEGILVDEYKLTNEYSSKEINLDLSSLECDSSYTISLEIESDGYECDLSDNYASREIYLTCEEPPVPSCGDGTCNGDENCTTCPEDCGICPPVPSCGDGTCNGDENCTTCPEDCGECECECEDECNEGCFTCPECKIDCNCGNGILEEGEECDDGNLKNFDGCSRTCHIEEEKERSIKPNRFVNFCESNWDCSAWSECSNGIRTRECVDDNSCKEIYNKPYEQTVCSEEIISSSYVKGIEGVHVEDTNRTYFWILMISAVLVIFLLIILTIFL